MDQLRLDRVSCDYSSDFTVSLFVGIILLSLCLVHIEILLTEVTLTRDFEDITV